ncbi:SOS response-associated peptidase family protein [Photobacterium sp. 1_MG-2023]|uniref:SOS response-associated peptidase family protein n=1 Tax=Photobacterium sp. 1_MG-2023 TaxID=3062646 RepID=UPI0026E1E34D|nr:SOS response-associated peptidase family protein [Photobacterium sp. 1_MG-2023]MDO6706770.1 SOS response-associated peptidase family protein [Photobacterium sp. 1_MG-2023]
MPHAFSSKNTICNVCHLLGETSNKSSCCLQITWRNAMQTHRCIAPCSGWYEWRDEGGTKKQQYLFSHHEGQPLYMAGIWFEAETPQSVTFTTAANEILTQCQYYMNSLEIEDG